MDTAVDCGQPPSTADGQVDASTTTLNSEATYQCDSGYEFESGSLTEVITCQADGTWSSSAPTCNGKYIPYVCVRMGWRRGIVVGGPCPGSPPFIHI